MGIKPSGDNPIIVPPDNIQSRWGEWEADLDAAGQVAGEVNLETWSLANSANEWVSDNSQKLYDRIDEALENSASIRKDIDEVSDDMDLLISDSEDSILWNMQRELDELQNQRDDLQDIAIEALQEAQKAQMQTVSRTIFVPRGVPIENEHFKVTYSPNNGNDWRVVAKPGWVGFFIWQSVYSSAANPAIDGFRVGATRQWDVAAWARHQSVITYWVQKGTPRTSNVSLTSPPVTVDTGWTRLDDLTFTAPVTDSEYPLLFRVGWENANYLDGFGIRILKNGVVTHSGIRTKFGPFVGNGYNTIAYNLDRYAMTAGDVIHFEVYTNASSSVNRIIRNAWRNTSWVEPFDMDDENPESPD